MGVRTYNSKGVDKKNAKCNMGFDFDTFTKKCSKTAEKFKLDKNKVKSKKGFRAYTSKGAKCNMGFGRMTKIYLLSLYSVKTWARSRWALPWALANTSTPELGSLRVPLTIYAPP